jgi:3-phosphoshikimate 1-carboxyvinyltransferase
VVFADVLERMGCTVHADSAGVRVSREPHQPLRGVDVDMSEISDLVPTLAVIGACAEGTTRIRGVGFIRAKESDRLGDLANELAKCGVNVSVEDDGLTIHGASLRTAIVDTHHDHRLAMSLALLSLRQEGIVVDDAEVVAKSWPSYWTAMRSGLALA